MGRRVFRVVLWPSEYQVALLTCEHALGVKQISHLLGLTPETVKTYKSNIYEKLGLRGEKELMLFYWTI